MISLIQYDSWANQRFIDSLTITPLPEALRLMSHIVMARSVWISRIKQGNQQTNPWQEYDLIDMNRIMAEQDEALSVIVGQMNIDSIINYQNSKGERFENELFGILHHLFLHSAYHRGQISNHLLRKNIKPPITDYIFYLRETGY